MTLKYKTRVIGENYFEKNLLSDLHNSKDKIGYWKAMNLSTEEEFGEEGIEQFQTSD